MASVVINGDTSGSVTLSAPTVAGSTTITLPTSTGTIALTSAVIGVEQTWQQFTTSGISPQRSINTDYTNSTGRPIMFAFSCSAGTSNITATINGIAFLIGSGSAAYYNCATIFVVIPAGNTYRISSFGAGSVTWAELR